MSGTYGSCYGARSGAFPPMRCSECRKQEPWTVAFLVLVFCSSVLSKFILQLFALLILFKMGRNSVDDAVKAVVIHLWNFMNRSYKYRNIRNSGPGHYFFKTGFQKLQLRGGGIISNEPTDNLAYNFDFCYHRYSKKSPTTCSHGEIIQSSSSSTTSSSSSSESTRICSSSYSWSLCAAAAAFSIPKPASQPLPSLKTEISPS